MFGAHRVVIGRRRGEAMHPNVANESAAITDFRCTSRILVLHFGDYAGGRGGATRQQAQRNIVGGTSVPGRAAFAPGRAGFVQNVPGPSREGPTGNPITANC